MSSDQPPKQLGSRQLARREFIKNAATGTLVVALGGGLYRLVGDDLISQARAEKRSDGRPRLPPGQKILKSLRPMGGQTGNARLKNFTLKLHGAVRNPTTLSYEQLRKVGVTKVTADVHCVTGWSVLGAVWTGVLVSDLAKLSGVKDSARYVIFEAAHGYTANVPIRAAMKPNVLVAFEQDGKPLARRHGAPVRGIVPDLYFWKSAKWVTGIKFVRRDEPGYWEKRGYHNYGDPWREQRYS